MDDKDDLKQHIINYLQEEEFRSYPKMMKRLRRHFKGIDQDYLKSVHAKWLKDSKVPILGKTGNNLIAPFKLKIFSSSPNCYFHDIFNNGSNGKPPYYHIFIGVNTRWAKAYPVKDREGSTCEKTIKEFVNEFHPQKLTSDAEKGFNIKPIREFLEENHCEVSIINSTASDHSGLGIIDRFIRTLRSMEDKKNNIIEIGGVRYTKDHKRVKTIEPINNEEMQRLIEVYNDTPHDSIGMSPNEMKENPKAEEKYIYSHLKTKDNTINKPGYELEPGTTVRHKKPHFIFAKSQKQFTEGLYTVTKQVGSKFEIKSEEDGSKAYFTRAQLIPTPKTEYNLWGNGFLQPLKPGRKPTESSNNKTEEEWLSPMKTRQQYKQEEEEKLHHMQTRSQARAEEEKAKINKRGKQKKYH